MDMVLIVIQLFQSALKEGSRDSEFFKKVQKALDSISDEEREEMMKYAVEHQPTED